MPRKRLLLVGLQRHGKTYFAEQTAKAYIKRGGTAVAYNLGMDRDFEDFSEIEALTPLKLSNLQVDKKKAKLALEKRSIDFFIYEGKIYHFKILRKMFAGKGVKMRRVRDGYEKMLCDCFFRNCYDCLLILDDNRAMTRHGMPHELIELVSRADHAGSDVLEKGSPLVGVDIILIYHGYEQVSVELYTYLTHIIQFKLSAPPTLRNENPILERNMSYCFNELLKLPMYSRAEMDVIFGTRKLLPHNA